MRAIWRGAVTIFGSIAHRQVMNSDVTEHDLLMHPSSIASREPDPKSRQTLHYRAMMSRDRSGVWIVAALLAVMFTGSTLPTPLYGDYRHVFGFSQIMLTLIFASYAAGNLIALFAIGRLSDQVGRQPVMLLALGFAAVSALLFGYAENIVWLFGARIFSGLAIGVGAGTATAWIVDLHPEKEKPRATIIIATFNQVGLGFGALLAGAMSQYGPWPLRLVYLVYLALLMIAAICVRATRETIQEPIHRPKDISLKPRLGVPETMRTAFVPPAFTAFGSFALIGFYTALAPSLLTTTLHQTNKAVSGAIVFELFLAAIVTTVVTKELRSKTAMLCGLGLFFPSVILLILAQVRGSMAILLIATAITGVSTALGFRGSLQVINAIAPPEQRAEVVSSYLIVSYAGNSLPVIGIGIMSLFASSLLSNGVFAAMICLLAVIALIVGIRVATPSQ